MQVTPDKVPHTGSPIDNSYYYEGEDPPQPSSLTSLN